MGIRPAVSTARDKTARRAVLSWIGGVFVGLAALLAYANSLQNQLVWDDTVTLSHTLVVFRSAGDVLAPPRNIPEYSPDYYRPVVFASYLLDRAIGGGKPFSFHLTVVLAHIATTLLVYALALQMLGSVRRSLPDGGVPSRDADQQRILGAFAASALFALHPIHTESVAWSSGRTDVFATGFLVATLLVHGRARPSWSGSALAGLCAAAALGAKETAVTLYPLMLLRDLLIPPLRPRSAAEWGRAYGGPLLAGTVYLLLRRNALGEVIGTAAAPLPVSQRSALDLVGAVGVYVEKLLWPVDLNAYIDHIVTSPLTVALCVLLMVGLVAAAWRWTTARADGLPLFAVAWIPITLMPSLAIVWKLPDAPIAERYLYLPSVGFCLLVGDAVGRLWALAASPAIRGAIGLGLAAVLVAAAVGTVQRNRIWHDDITLFEDTEPKSQESGMVACTLGNAYQEAGRSADARAAFERALQRRCTPRVRQTAYSNLGTMAAAAGNLNAAQQFYEAALQANSNSADTLFNLGNVLMYRGKNSPSAAQLALPYYQRALSLNPYDPDIEAFLAQALAVLGQSDLAAQHARRALQLGARTQALNIANGILRSGGSAGARP